MTQTKTYRTISENLRDFESNFQMPCQQHLKYGVQLYIINKTLQKAWRIVVCFTQRFTSSYTKSKQGRKWKWKEIDQTPENEQNENSDGIKQKSALKSLNLSNFMFLWFFVKNMAVTQSLLTRKSNRLQKKPMTQKY